MEHKAAMNTDRDKRVLESMAKDMAIDEAIKMALLFLCGFLWGCIFVAGVLTYFTWWTMDNQDRDKRIEDLEEAYDDAFPFGWGGI